MIVILTALLCTHDPARNIDTIINEYVSKQQQYWWASELGQLLDGIRESSSIEDSLASALHGLRDAEQLGEDVPDRERATHAATSQVLVEIANAQKSLQVPVLGLRLPSDPMSVVDKPYQYVSEGFWLDDRDVLAIEMWDDDGKDIESRMWYALRPAMTRLVMDSILDNDGVPTREQYSAEELRLRVLRDEFINKKDKHARLTGSAKDRSHERYMFSYRFAYMARQQILMRKWWKNGGWQKILGPISGKTSSIQVLHTASLSYCCVAALLRCCSLQVVRPGHGCQFRRTHALPFMWLTGSHGHADTLPPIRLLSGEPVSGMMMAQTRPNLNGIYSGHPWSKQLWMSSKTAPRINSSALF